MNDRLIKKLWHTNRKYFVEQFSILQTINSDGQFEHTYFEYDSKKAELVRLSACQIVEIDCTGLKDKNGKLVFEGDILEIDISKNKAKVVWNTDCFAITVDDERYCFIPMGIGFKIIGNIYENPELLEDGE